MYDKDVLIDFIQVHFQIGIELIIPVIYGTK